MGARAARRQPGAFHGYIRAAIPLARHAVDVVFAAEFLGHDLHVQFADAARVVSFVVFAEDRRQIADLHQRRFFVLEVCLRLQDLVSIERWPPEDIAEGRLAAAPGEQLEFEDQPFAVGKDHDFAQQPRSVVNGHRQFVARFQV